MATFSAAELATLRALAATFVPAADAERVAAIAADALVRAVDPAQLTQLRLVLRLLEQPAREPRHGSGDSRRSGTWTRLTRERTAAALGRLAACSCAAPASHAFRKLLTFIAYADPGTPEAPNPLPLRHRLRARRSAASARAGRDPAGRRRSPARARRRRRFGSRRTSSSSARARARGVVAAELARAGRSRARRRGRAVRGRGDDAPRRARRVRPAVPELRPALDLGRRDHDARRLGRRRRDARQLDDLPRCPGRGPRGVGARARPRRRRRRGVGRRHRGDRARARRRARDRDPAEGRAASGAAPPRSAGNRGVIRRNATDCGDCGSCPFGCRRGAKQSGIRAHLAEAVAHGARGPRSRPRAIGDPARAPGRAGVVGVAGTLATGCRAPRRDDAAPRRFSGPRPPGRPRRRRAAQPGDPAGVGRSITRRSAGTCASTRCRSSARS